MAYVSFDVAGPISPEDNNPLLEIFGFVVFPNGPTRFLRCRVELDLFEYERSRKRVQDIIGHMVDSGRFDVVNQVVQIVIRAG